jgi:phosphatidylinositol-3-phosphatase
MASILSTLGASDVGSRVRSRLPADWNRGRTITLVAALVAVALVVGMVGYTVVQRFQHYTKLEAVPAGSTLPVPATSPVIVVMFENKSELDVLGSPEAPYLTSLIAKGALATDFQGIAHPSQPNYLALFSGSPQGVVDDDVHDLAAPTIADQLEAAGKTWRVFAENLPASACFTGATASGGPDGDGVYARKHNPAISFTGISSAPSRCANIQPLAALTPDAADFIWIVPNMCNSMHDCPTGQGDAWFKTLAPRILDSPAFQPGGHGVLYVTFDESDDKARRNEIRTLALGPTVKAGSETPVAHNHYSLLRTIEEGLGLPCLALACSANTMGEMFNSAN